MVGRDEKPFSPGVPGCRVPHDVCRLECWASRVLAEPGGFRETREGGLSPGRPLDNAGLERVVYPADSFRR